MVEVAEGPALERHCPLETLVPGEEDLPRSPGATAGLPAVRE